MNGRLLMQLNKEENGFSNRLDVDDFRRPCISNPLNFANELAAGYLG